MQQELKASGSQLNLSELTIGLEQDLYKKISLSKNKLGDEGAGIIGDKIGKCKKLSYLKLERNEIGDVGLARLTAGLEVNQSITTADFSYNIFGSHIGSLSRMFKCNSSLQVLRLDGNALGKSGAAILATGLAEHKTLFRLSISNNDIGDDGAASIAQSLEEGKSNLRLLDMRKNQITDKGIQALAQALKQNKKLLVLNINDNNYGYQGINALSNALTYNQNLLELYINDGNLGSDSIEAIRLALYSNNNLLTINIRHFHTDIESRLEENKALRALYLGLSIIRESANEEHDLILNSLADVSKLLAEGVSELEEKQEVENSYSIALAASQLNQDITKILSQITNGQALTADLRGLRLTRQDMALLSKQILNSFSLGDIHWGETTENCDDIKKAIEKHIKANNANYRAHPNDYEQGLLSHDVYKDRAIGDAAKGLQGENLVDWRVVKITEDKADCGYWGTLYENAKTGQLVLAHRGTEASIADLFKSDSDIQTDIKGILQGALVAQQAWGYMATKSAVEYARGKGYRLSITGHSLGAWLAELSVYYCHWDFEYRQAKAVTFDSPGSLAMLEKFKPNVRNIKTELNLDNYIKTYLSAPNPVNSCNGHVGKIYRIYPELSVDEWVAKIKTVPFVGTQVGRAINRFSMVQGHSLKLILQYFDPGSGLARKYEEVLDWPSIKYEGENGNGLDRLLDKIPYLRNIPNEILKPISGWIKERTLGSMLDVLAAFCTGGIKYDQYWKLFEHLDSSQGYALKEDIEVKEEFYLTYESHYKTRTVDVSRDVLDKRSSSDEYLELLYVYKDSLRNSDRIREILKVQIADLVANYELQKDDEYNRQLIVSKTIAVDVVRERARRLFRVYEQELTDELNILKYRWESTKKENVVSNLPAQGMGLVVRSSMEDELAAKLNEKKVVVMRGLSGVGKSCLALSYGYKQGGGKNSVKWIASDSQNKIAEELIELAKDLGQAEKIIGKTAKEVSTLVSNELRKYGKSIFIFDGAVAESSVVIKEFISRLADNVKVIITTSDGTLFGEKDYGQLEILEFNEQEAISYVATHLSVSKLDAKKFVNEVGLLPTRLKQALTLYDRFKDLNTWLANYHALKLAKDISIIDQIPEENINAWNLLQYIAYLDGSFISLDLLKELGFIDGLEDSIKYLESHSLIKFTVNNTYDRGISIPKLVQNDSHIYRTNFPEKSIVERELLEKLALALDKLYPYVESIPDRRWSIAKIYSNHILLLLSKFNKDVKSSSYANLLHKIGKYKQEVLCDYQSSYDFYQLAETLYDKVGDIHNQLKVLIDLGQRTEKIGKFDESLKYYESAYNLALANYGANSEKLVTLHYVIASAKHTLGREDAALLHLEEANRLCNRDDIVSLINIKMRIGELQQILGRMSDAIISQEESLKLRESYYRANSPIIAAGLNNLGLAYSGFKDHSKALEYYGKSVAIYKKVYGDKHVLTIKSKFNQGNAYRCLEKIAEAVETYEGILAAARIAYGKYHVYVGIILQELGECYKCEDNLEQALNFYEQALVAYQNSCGADSLLAKSCLGKMATIYEELGYQEKAQIYRGIITSDINQIRRSGETSNLAILKKLLSCRIINQVMKFTNQGCWTYKYLTGVYDWGIAGYLEESYLRRELGGQAVSVEEITTAREMCFEAMNIAIVKDNLGQLELAFNFTDKYQDIVKHIAKTHPEYFVDTRIMERLEGYHRSSEVNNLSRVTFADTVDEKSSIRSR